MSDRKHHFWTTKFQPRRFVCLLLLNYKNHACVLHLPLNLLISMTNDFCRAQVKLSVIALPDVGWAASAGLFFRCSISSILFPSRAVCFLSLCFRFLAGLHTLAVILDLSGSGLRAQKLSEGGCALVLKLAAYLDCYGECWLEGCGCHVGCLKTLSGFAEESSAVVLIYWLIHFEKLAFQLHLIGQSFWEVSYGVAQGLQFWISFLEESYVLSF